MSKNLKKILSLLLACMMCVGLFAGCKDTEEPKGGEDPVVDQPEKVVNETPLVAAYSSFSEKFSPFFSESAYDRDVVDVTSLLSLTKDRSGGIIYNAIEGETVNYNGTDYKYTGPCNVAVNHDSAADITTYTIKMRDDIKFSDGVSATADDILFFFYVVLDPSFVGQDTTRSYDIIGLRNYQTQTTDDIYDKYAAMFADVYAAGEGYTVKGGESFTQEQYDKFWNEILPQAWKDDVQSIVTYVLNEYSGSFTDYMDESLELNDKTQIAFGMRMWGFGKFDTTTDADGNKTKTLDANGNLIFKGAVSGKTWDLVNTFPTIDDYYEECKAAYEGDPEAYWDVEQADSDSVIDAAKTAFISQLGSADPGMSGGVPNISGIKKLDEYTVEIKTKGYSAPAVYTICDPYITPLHYYGDESQWDPDNGLFGHPFGDLSIVEAKTNSPMGAGPYKFVKYENKVVYFEANENFYKGEPKTKYLQFKETLSNEVASAVAAGTVDAGEMTGSKDRFNEVKSFNSNGEVTGDVIATSKVDNLGYGYIGICAANVKVGDDQGSEASKNLRKAIATVLAVYRDTAYDSYYGDAASVIQYPISNTSWAAPQPTDADFKAAFSVDINGNDIYTSEMTADQRYAAAKQAALGFLEAAGFTVENGKAVAAPEGAKLTYEAVVPGDGQGDHPSFAVLTDTKAALAEIGIELKINDPANSDVMWDMLDVNEQELWCAAWSSGLDPDMYQIYHSSGIVGRGGSDSNHYCIDSAELDQLIVDARKSDDQAYRKAIYKQCLDLIVDYAVEIPAYQRQNCIIFSSQRINLDTLTPDITTFWGWLNDIELVEMK